MRLLRHLSFSNVIAMLALFVALGGAAYAGTTINGSSIKNGSIGGGKLKNETITANKLKKGTLTGAQIAPGSITSSSINESTLGIVPSAQNATTAGTATKAKSATTAGTATTATSATTAKSAETAKHAETADSAKHAETATAATHADSATTAGEAEKFGGKTAGELRAEFEISCPSATEFYGGMCWDQTTRPPRLWLVAVRECGEAGGRLPTIEELIAFVLQDGVQVNAQTWSGDIDSLAGGPKEEMVFSSDENGRSTANGSLLGGLLGYRCVFPQSN
jgi:hypothetical protein